MKSFQIQIRQQGRGYVTENPGHFLGMFNPGLVDGIITIAQSSVGGKYRIIESYSDPVIVAVDPFNGKHIEDWTPRMAQDWVNRWIKAGKPRKTDQFPKD